MKIGDFKKFKGGLTVTCGPCDFLDIYMIDIDEYRIELSDCNGMVSGTINSDQIDNCEVIMYQNGEIVGTSDLNEL